MFLSFAHLWQQQESSDVDVILLTQQRVQLVQFPAHRLLLSNSPVFRAKVLRWQQGEEQQPAPTAKRARRSSATANNDGSSKQVPTTSTAKSRLELELQDASQQPAATAVLAALYAVKPLHELLLELSQEHQLLAALLADQWQIPSVSSAAAALLADAANSGALVKAVRQQVLQDVLPDCLQPLLKSVLLSVLGDLEAVWADAGLSQQLLRLSLPAMEVLLSCDAIKAASEDTVLYTAQRYVDSIADEQQRQDARQRLPPLIRCPQLSRYWLSLSVNASTADKKLLAGLRPNLQQLLLVRDIQSDYQVKPADLQETGLLAGAPASWGLGSRVSKPVASVQVLWELDVSELRAAAQRSATTEQQTVVLHCPHVSPPLGGIAFGLFCGCRQGQEGVDIGLYGVAAKLPAGACALFSGVFEVDGLEPQHTTTLQPLRGRGWGFHDAFDVGAMAGGWDEAAWAAKGLPTSGSLTIKFTCPGCHTHRLRPALQQLAAGGGDWRPARLTALSKTRMCCAC